MERNKLKIIVSHDVDHLYPSDHLLRDFYFPKLWVRSVIQFIEKRITVHVLFARFLSIFKKRLNCIPEICKFDIENGVCSTFFFGMSKALGMSYARKDAADWIKFVIDKGFDAGVHGCEYKDYGKMRKEYEYFQDISGLSFWGIRNHYVRYDKDTFRKMSEIGYLFDSSEFNKEMPTFKKPYKVGKMWEFPLAIMEGYVIKNDLETTKAYIESFLSNLPSDLRYLTILFHDVFYDEECYPLEKAFYEWLIRFLNENGFEFISYVDAINELENEGNN